MTRLCAVEGCDRPHLARGWCDPHYRRWRRRGVADGEVAVRSRARPDPARVGYRAALQRVRAGRGPAAAQACALCGGAAAVWCYDGEDPEERRDDRGRRYSLDGDRYRPCCRFCHRRIVVDRRAEMPAGVVATPAFDVDRAVRLYRAGAASTGIAALLRVSPAAVISALRQRGVPIRSRRQRSDS